MSIRLPHSWTTAAHCGTTAPPYKCGTAAPLRRPPPERDRMSMRDRSISWLLILVLLLAACMGGYILGISLLGAALCRPTSLTIVASKSHVETHSHHNYGDTGGTHPASSARQEAAAKGSESLMHGSGPERGLSDYALRRAAAVQIPGAKHDRKAVQAKAAIKQLQLVPCGKAGVNTSSCGRALAHPKVALMFLSTGDMPHEELWRTWLASAQGDGVSQQHLFSVLVHPPPNHAGYPKGSLFHGKIIRSRVATDWGDHSLVEVLQQLAGTYKRRLAYQATQLLIREALEDPLNYRFVLLSESCAPLYSALATYLQLMGQASSRINACAAKDSVLNSERWRELLFEKGALPLAQWRKSAQWFGLTRPHAQLVAADTQLVAAFGDLCRLQKAEEGASFLNCHSDENYIPSLLAKAGLDNETDCIGSLTYSEWSVSQYGDAYPRYFLPSEISGDFIEHLRSPEDICETANADAAIASTFVRLVRGEGGSQIDVHPCTHGEGSAGGGRGADVQTERLPPALALSYHCPLFARKFSRFTAEPLLGLYHVDEGLAIFHGVCPFSGSSSISF